MPSTRLLNIFSIFSPIVVNTSATSNVAIAVTAASILS